ncbi:hypothetical protein EJB05_50918, partial [Eragrostis curvula]
MPTLPSPPSPAPSSRPPPPPPPPPAPGTRVGGMAPTRLADGGGELHGREADRIEEEEDCFVPVDKYLKDDTLHEEWESTEEMQLWSMAGARVISQGINIGDVKKLQDVGIFTCNGLIVHSKKSLKEIMDLSEAKVEKIYQAAKYLLSIAPITTRSQVAASFASTVAEAVPRPLPTAILENLEPFAQLVRLIGQDFYSDVGITKGEIKVGCDDNCGIVVVVLTNLTSLLASYIAATLHTIHFEIERLLKKKLVLLILFILWEVKAQVNVDATLATYASHNCQNFEEKKNDTMSMLPGPYCCLDYSQICDVTRYRLYRMKEAVKDKLECGDTLQDNIEEYICRICKKSYSAFDAMHLINKGGDTFCCKICNGELVARIDLDGSRKERRKNLKIWQKECMYGLYTPFIILHVHEQLKPLQIQLDRLKDLPVPEFGTLEEWRQNDHISTPFLTQTTVELSNPFAEEDGAQSSSNFQGSKVLPTWIIRKGMALEKAEKGKQGSNNDETDRQVGVKSKRGDGDYGDDGASIRRRI